MQAVIMPTDRCNLRCKHCLRSQYKDEDLSLNDLRLFLSEFECNLLGYDFCLTGGEATLHREFSNILEILGEYDFTGSIVTNGQNLEGINEIVNYKKIFNYVLISLEGPIASVNDSIRGRGSFEKAVHAIKILKANGIKVHIRNTLNAKNIDYIEEMFVFARKLKIDLLNFSIIQPCKNGLKNNILITWERFEEAKAEFKEVYIKYPEVKAIFGTRNIKKFFDSEWPQNLCRPMDDKHGEITLKPNGDISLCCDLSDFGFNSDMLKERNYQKLSHILGNIKKNCFEEILKNKEKITKIILRRRREDAFWGRLGENRESICENCKFYFYKEA